MLINFEKVMTRGHKTVECTVGAVKERQCVVLASNTVNVVVLTLMHRLFSAAGKQLTTHNH